MYYDQARKAINDTLEDMYWAFWLIDTLLMLALLITKLKIFAYCGIVLGILMLVLVVYDIIVWVKDR